MKATFLTLFVALALALVLAACGSTKETNFPTGKFIKTGTTNYGLIFNEDGTFSVFDGNSTIVRGTYSVDGDTYTDKSNNVGCLDEPKSFKYTFDGTNLTFKYIGDPANDACDGRRDDFNNVTYALSQ